MISYPGPTATYNMSKRHDDETEYTGVKDADHGPQTRTE